MRFTGLEDPVLKDPFTVVDPAGSVWTIATDRVWFVAAKDRNTCPRFKGETQALFTVLRLIGMKPCEPTTFDRQGTLEKINLGISIGNVLGVPVSLRRLHDLLSSLPHQQLDSWNASKDLGVPGVGFHCDGWRAFLIGFEDLVGEVPSVELVPQPLSAFDRVMALDD